MTKAEGGICSDTLCMWRKCHNPWKKSGLGLIVELDIREGCREIRPWSQIIYTYFRVWTNKHHVECGQKMVSIIMYLLYKTIEMPVMICFLHTFLYL